MPVRNSNFTVAPHAPVDTRVWGGCSRRVILIESAVVSRREIHRFFVESHDGQPFCCGLVLTSMRNRSLLQSLSAMPRRQPYLTREFTKRATWALKPSKWFFARGTDMKSTKGRASNG